MIKDEEIICISTIDWDFLWQGHQEIMTRLARNGNRVLFIENTGVRAPRMSDFGRIKSRILNWKRGVHGIRKIEDGLYVYSPLVLPFPYLKIARFINKRLVFAVLFKWLKTVGFSEPIVWTFLPTGLTLDLVDKIRPKLLVYYCIDSFQASSRDARKIRATESALLRKADLVFVTSQELFRYCSQYNSKVYYFPFGVNIENFKRALTEGGAQPDDMKGIKRPIAGYIGGIHKWIDFDLVRHVALKNQGVSFVFCGPLQTDIGKLKDVPNIFFLGQKSAAELPVYVREFDVALIPYRMAEYTKNVYPTKLNEYLSMGKRVVSTELPEVVMFNKENKGVVDLSPTPDAFAEAVQRAVGRPVSENESFLAREAAEKNSWSHKIEAMSTLITEAERRKMQEREALWKNNLARLYKKTTRGFVWIAAVAILAYLVLFHTSFLWLAAEPLKINEAPQKSDAIIVLGGGVGESGKAGQGYQERVDTAVRLYKKNYAGIIVYLSGYKYIMDETQVMKALSVSLGVDASAIVLDDAVANTFEMVMDLKGLAAKNGWKKIILVSSPYHMLRVKLLCDKNMKGVSVIYLPAEKTSYYTRGRSVTLEQVEGVVREYAAILYYKLKGRI